MAEARPGALSSRRSAETAPTFPLSDLPNDLLVSVFEAVGDLCWVRHTVPCVCKAWAELYRSKNASPLHETLELDFQKEEAAASRAVRRRDRIRDRRGLGPLATSAEAQDREWDSGLGGDSVLFGSRAVEWVERRAGSVRKLHIRGEPSGDFGEGFNSEEVGGLVAAAGSSLAELCIDWFVETEHDEDLWRSLRKHVFPHRRLRSLVVKGTFADDVCESDVEPLGQLAGCLEELVLRTSYAGEPEESQNAVGLRRFPESLCALTELRRLELVGHEGISALPARISSLRNLEELTVGHCLSSLPKELGELSRLTKLDLFGNMGMGTAPQDEAFPAELGRKMKSLRVLNLSLCGLRAVPAFVGELESLECLDLSENDAQIRVTLDLLIEGCPRLREVRLGAGTDASSWNGAIPWTPEARAHLDAFKARLLAQNPNAEVIFE